MAKQTFTTGSVLTATQMNNLQANDYNWTVSQKTASYVLVAADAGTRIEMNSGSPTTVTVNTGLFTAGDTLFIQNIGAGACTVTAGTATVNKATAGSLTLSQYQGGTLYFVSASSAIFFADAGYTPPLTTKGDLFGFDTAAARIPIGSNNQVLTADSSQALGLKWATPATGAFTLLSTNTLSSTVTQISSISSAYKHLFIWIIGWKAGGGTALQFQFGANGTYSTHNYYMNIRTSAGATDSNNNGGNISLATNVSGTGDGADISAWIYNYTDTNSRKNIAWNGAFLNNSAVQGCFFGAGSVGQTTGALSTICLGAGSGTQSGTAYIYGVN